jgi:hypothetical protein
VIKVEFIPITTADYEFGSKDSARYVAKLTAKYEQNPDGSTAVRDEKQCLTGNLNIDVIEKING